MNLNRKLALLAVPAVLALSGGALAVQAAPTPNSPAPESQAGVEPAETTRAAETVDATEVPGAPNVGHADAAGSTVDHQYEGNE
ncbi:MAG: hypothetical protein ACYDAL_13765 [Candidatus Dormibacteraceae bacterium]